MLPRYAAFYARCATNTHPSFFVRGTILRGYESHCNTCRNEQEFISAARPPQVTGTIPRGGRGIGVGQYAEMHRAFTAEEIFQYGSLIGDLNPIHLEGHIADDGDGTASSDYAANIDSTFIRRRSKDGRPEAIVHGMLVGSLFSSIFGTLIPGSVYRSQRLEFRQPVLANDPIVARVVVSDVRNMKGRGLLVTCDTTIARAEKESEKYVEGEAKVWLPGA